MSSCGVGAERVEAGSAGWSRFPRLSRLALDTGREAVGSTALHPVRGFTICTPPKSGTQSGSASRLRPSDPTGASHTRRQRRQPGSRLAPRVWYQHASQLASGPTGAVSRSDPRQRGSRLAARCFLRVSAWRSGAARARGAERAARMGKELSSATACSIDASGAELLPRVRRERPSAASSPSSSEKHSMSDSAKSAEQLEPWLEVKSVGQVVSALLAEPLGTFPSPVFEPRSFEPRCSRLNGWRGCVSLLKTSVSEGMPV